MSRHAFLAEALRIIPGEWELLRSVGPTNLRTSHPTAGTTAGAHPPLNLTVVHLLDTTRPSDWWGLDPRSVHVSDLAPLAMLESWSRVIHEDAMELGLDYPDLTDPATIATECAWLLAMLDYACAQQWATEMARDIATLRHSLRTALGDRIPPARTCLACSSPRSAVYTHADTRMVCLECEASWDSGRTAPTQPPTPPEAPVTIPTAAEALGLSHWTIRSWITRNRLPHTHDDHGRLTVRISDVERLCNATRLQNHTLVTRLHN